MAVGASKKYRIIRRDFVEVPTRRKHRWLPERLDPAPAGDPFGRLCLVDARFHFGQKVFQVRDAFKVEIHLALANADEMIVGIGHPRHHRGAVEIDNAGVRALVLFYCGV